MSVRPLPAALAEKAQTELKEDADRHEDSIRHLKEWILQQPHLRARTEDQWLTAFLRGCKYNLEKAKKKILLYYTLRSTAPDFYNLKYNDPKFMEVLELGVDVILPKTKNATDPRVILIRPGQFDPKKYSASDIMAVSLVKQQISYLEDDNLIVSGAVNVMDLGGTSMAHFTQMTPMLMKKLVQANQDAAPIRVKGVHFINMPNGLQAIFNVAKSLLNKKNRSRLHVHNKSDDTLLDHIRKEILPKEYDGEAGTIQDITDHWKGKIKEYSSWLDEDLRYGVENDERQENGSYGIKGSFKKLQLD